MAVFRMTKCFGAEAQNPGAIPYWGGLRFFVLYRFSSLVKNKIFFYLSRSQKPWRQSLLGGANASRRRGYCKKLFLKPKK